MNFSKFLTEMSRGVLVVDENLIGLEDELRKRNIKVIVPKRNMSDEDIKHELLTHRIIVTNNTKDFIDAAVEVEYGIIATENIKFKDSKRLADIISKAIIKFNLWGVRSGFILTLEPNNNHNFKILPS